MCQSKYMYDEMRKIHYDSMIPVKNDIIRNVGVYC
jgi:hypothetical protein